MSNSKMTWPCTVIAETHHPSGRPVRMRRVVDGAGSVEAVMQSALSARKDKGAWFRGDAVTAITPLGQRVIGLIDPDTGHLVPVRRQP